MKTSARNQWPGTVVAITRGAVNDEVELALEGGQTIVAVVTRESTTSLGLAPGVKAFALIKASSVILVTDAGDVRFSARNQLRGTVARMQPGAVNAEVELKIGEGLTLTAIVTEQSARSLGLAPGTPATAIFKASSVLIGVVG